MGDKRVVELLNKSTQPTARWRDGLGVITVVSALVSQTADGEMEQYSTCSDAEHYIYFSPTAMSE